MDNHDARPPDYTVVARAAAQLAPDHSVVGLGTGRAATAFVRALADRVHDGLEVRCVATSVATEQLARDLGLSVTNLEAAETIDLAVDGADEVDPALNLIKGLGGALVREKIVESAARRLIILVGPEKLVPALGAGGVLPVEIVPFGLAFCVRRLRDLGYPGEPRRRGENLFVSDNGNYILDCRIPTLSDPGAVDQAIRGIPGVVATGLFVDMTDTVLIAESGGVRRVSRAHA